LVERNKNKSFLLFLFKKEFIGWSLKSQGGSSSLLGDSPQARRCCGRCLLPPMLPHIKSSFVSSIQLVTSTRIISLYQHYTTCNCSTPYKKRGNDSFFLVLFEERKDSFYSFIFQYSALLVESESLARERLIVDKE
jgi:hypothetical protein